MGTFDSATQRAAFAVFDTESVTITRSTPGAPNPSSPTPTAPTISTVWSGNADLQSTGGSIFVNGQGVQEVSDATLTINATSTGVLPAVKLGDLVTFGTTKYTVVNVGQYTKPIAYVECMLKRGNIPYNQPRR